MSKRFNDYSGHVVVAATGLVVRIIAKLAASKKTDPAVVTLGQDGRFVVSLLSGHLGGANELARLVATVTGGQAVITTATDLQDVPAMEVLAYDLGLKCPDLGPLPLVSRTLSEGGKVEIHDPRGFLRPSLGAWPGLFEYIESPPRGESPAVMVTHQAIAAPPNCLVMRPPALAVGLGCHRDCPASELGEFITGVLERESLSFQSVAVLATVDSRALPGLAPLGLAREWRLPLLSYGPDKLSAIQAPNPSETVLRRIGAASVCEASATLAARKGPLIVTKQKGPRVTCAVALIDCQ
jgi:cobalt-precorrin 5A hydrolase